MVDEWQPMGPIPALTAEVAHASFPAGCLAMHLRDVFYGLYRNHEFADLFAIRGQPALLPWRLALISVLQFVEDLSIAPPPTPCVAASTGSTPSAWS